MPKKGTSSHQETSLDRVWGDSPPSWAGRGVGVDLKQGLWGISEWKYCVFLRKWKYCVSLHHIPIQGSF